MYIAVLPYNRGSIYTDSSDVLVLDTSDGSLETVSCRDIIRTGIAVENIVLKRDTMTCEVWEEDMRFILEPQHTDESHYFRALSQDVYKLGDETYKIEHPGGGGIKLNGMKLRCKKCTMGFVYMFKFRGRTILRFKELGENNTYWYSAVRRKDGGFDQWDSNMNYCTNKELALQVDTLSRM